MADSHPGNSPTSRCHMAHCSAVVPLLRLPAKADDEHPLAAITAPRAHGRGSPPTSCPAVDAATPASRHRGGGGEGVSWIRKALRRVFHIISTGVPALAVQVGRLRHSPRQCPAGAGGLRFPGKQGTGLQQVIHSVSRPEAPKRPGWSLAILRFSTGSPGGRVLDGRDPAARRGSFRRAGGRAGRQPSFLLIHRLRRRGVAAR